MSGKEIGVGGYTYEYGNGGDGRTQRELSKVRCVLNGDEAWGYWYGYDGGGNLVSEVSEREYGNRVVGRRAAEYGYDGAERLTTERIEENGRTVLNKRYSYGESGKGKGKLWKAEDLRDGKKSINYEYDGRGRIGGYEQSGKAYSYIYDNYGNVKEKRKGEGKLYECEWTRGNLLKGIEKDGRSIKYDYNHRNVRWRKEVNGDETRYILDGGKILGEESAGRVLRYYYDGDGLMGLKLNGEIYRYVKDGQDNIVGIADKEGVTAARYVYDSMGNTEVRTAEGEEDWNDNSVGNINPFRWKSFYYDKETGLYNANGRYYEAERGGYIDALEADSIESGAYDLMGLDRNGVICSALMALAPYYAAIETSLRLTPDPLYDPNAGRTWWGKHGTRVILNAVSIAAGIVMLATGNAGGVVMIASGVIGIVGELVSEQLAGAAGLAMIGVQTIALGVKALSCCTPFGIIAAAVGAACVAFATAEAQEGLGYGNWMKDAGLSDGWYTGLMTAANAAAIAANLIGPKCFKEGTLVETEEGLKPIEKVVVGESVLAYDEATGKQEYKKVVKLFRNKAQTSTTTHFDCMEEPIVSTPEHPYFVLNESADTPKVMYEGCFESKNGHWVAAKDLINGNKCLLSSGKTATITSIKTEQCDEFDTFNFEVVDFHTYYVGEEGILVHNACANAAMRAAKRSENISMNEKPLRSINDLPELKMAGENGRIYYAKADLY